MSKKPFAVVLFGSPGSGKSTQAELLAKKLNLVHFNTGKYVERYISDPAHKNEPDAKKARKQFMSGELCDSRFILHTLSHYVHFFASQGESVVFSGSPRTEFEAFGDASHEGLVRVLDKEYGKNRVLYFVLDAKEENAKKRNAKRLVCEECGNMLLGAALGLKLKTCPFCGGKLYKRALDDPKTIEKRFEVYRTETVPVFSRIGKSGHPVHVVPADAMPFAIFRSILGMLEKLKVIR